MKKNFITSLLLLVSVSLFAQTKLDSLVQVGVKYHDQGNYADAIAIYKKALEIDPKSTLVNYEMSMTYMYAKEYENSIKHSDLVISQNSGHLLHAYLTKGSCLDYLGKTDESIRLFEEAIDKVGKHHLLYYNLGYDYYRLKNYEKAQEALIAGIQVNPNHPSSHLVLAYMMSDLNQKVQSLLSLHYFLLLEPGSERSKTAYALLQKQFGGNVEKDKNKPNQITIFYDPKQSESEFGPAALMISMLAASKSLKENKRKTEEELFVENTTSFFKVLGELKKDTHSGLWWNFYVPLFYKLAQSKHMEAYCNYISQSSNTKAAEWVKANEGKLTNFAQWLNEETKK
jgi:tetratricopeptide (TPR) repeat protein